MTVPSGRASSGARSVLRAVFYGVFAIVGLVAGGCGNDTFNYGTTIVTMSADPGPFKSYVADIVSFSLLRSDGTLGYTFSTGSGYGKTIDFARLGDTIELFGAPAVLEGTYTQASITINYGAGGNSVGSQIFVDVAGVSKAATVVDQTGATPTTISYTVQFDPANPLVVAGGKPSKLELHFDLNASTTLNTTVSPVTATVRPFMTASTLPATSTKPFRTRGEFVVASTGDKNFTINSVSFNDSSSYTNSAQGAIQVNTSDQTTYNVNGQVFTGSGGLAALSALPLNTVISAYGTLTDTTQQKPIFTATEVYAGLAAESVLATRVQGTVASRSGNTVHLRNADLIATNSIPGIYTPTGTFVKFLNDVTVTVSDTTFFDVDRQPNTPSSAALLSVGQQVEVVGVLSAIATDTATITADGGLVRLNPTTAWGNLTTATAGSATIDLLSLGGVDPTTGLTFAGTGTTAANDAVAANYAINTGTLDLSPNLSAGQPPLIRLDGLVNPFGTAPPDFTASAATLGSAITEQVLTIDWGSTGTTAPFASQNSTGLVVDLSNASLGTSHAVLIGPTSIDLTTTGVNPTIVPNGALTGQFASGNPSSTTGLSVYNAFPTYVTHLGTVINGTNKVQKLVAVGTWDSTTNTFTAYRIDIVQLP